MAEEGFIQLFRSVEGQMSNLTTTVGAQGVAKIVQNFDGSNQKEYKGWIKSIEKYATLTNIHADRTKLIAYQASTGPVSDFLKRYLAANQADTWFKAELRHRFGEVVDCQHALLLLRRVKQKSGESIQVFAERLLALGEEAFEGQGQNAVQTQLIGYFIDGLYQDSMKMKVMRANPQTFNDAVRVATNEQNLRKRFQLRTGHNSREEYDVRSEREPMEVDHYRPTNRCFYCKGKGHTIENCRLRKQKQGRVNAVREPQVRNRRNVICYRCREPGHIARECQQKNESLNGQASLM